MKKLISIIVCDIDGIQIYNGTSKVLQTFKLGFGSLEGTFRSKGSGHQLIGEYLGEP